MTTTLENSEDFRTDEDVQLSLINNLKEYHLFKKTDNSFGEFFNNFLNIFLSAFIPNPTYKTPAVISDLISNLQAVDHCFFSDVDESSLLVINNGKNAIERMKKLWRQPKSFSKDPFLTFIADDLAEAAKFKHIKSDPIDSCIFIINVIREFLIFDETHIIGGKYHILLNKVFELTNQRSGSGSRLKNLTLKANIIDTADKIISKAGQQVNLEDLKCLKFYLIEKTLSELIELGKEINDRNSQKIYSFILGRMTHNLMLEAKNQLPERTNLIGFLEKINVTAFIAQTNSITDQEGRIDLQQNSSIDTLKLSDLPHEKGIPDQSISSALNDFLAKSEFFKIRTIYNSKNYVNKTEHNQKQAEIADTFYSFLRQAVDRRASENYYLDIIAIFSAAGLHWAITRAVHFSPQ